MCVGRTPCLWLACAAFVLLCCTMLKLFLAKVSTKPLPLPLVVALLAVAPFVHPTAPIGTYMHLHMFKTCCSRPCSHSASLLKFLQPQCVAVPFALPMVSHIHETQCAPAMTILSLVLLPHLRKALLSVCNRAQACLTQLSLCCALDLVAGASSHTYQGRGSGDHPGEGSLCCLL